MNPACIVNWIIIYMSSSFTNPNKKFQSFQLLLLSALVSILQRDFRQCCLCGGPVVVFLLAIYGSWWLLSPLHMKGNKSKTHYIMHTIAVGWFDLWGRCFGTMISGFVLTYDIASQHLTDSLTLQNHFNQGILRYWFFYTSLRPVPVGARSWIRGFRRHSSSEIFLAAARLVDQHLFKMSTREIVNIFFCR